MSSYYLPQPFNEDENHDSVELSDVMGGILLTNPLRLCIIAAFRVLTGFVSLDIARSQGTKGLPDRLADGRQMFLEYIGDLFDEQAKWSETSHTIRDIQDSAPNN